MKTRHLFASMTPLAVAASLLLPLGQSAPSQDPPPDRGGMPDLPQALRDTPGCLGVETGRMSSGKQTILAWFESPQAVRRWYYSDTHEGVMSQLAPSFEGRKPLEAIDDDEGPILVIATITPADKPAFENISMPISQISIELYKPLPGGAHLGGRLAPEEVEVEGMRDYTP